MLSELKRIVDNGGRCEFIVWENGDRVDGCVGTSDYDEAMRIAKENNATEIESAIWYKDEDYNSGIMADDFVVVWHR